LGTIELGVVVSCHHRPPEQLAAASSGVRAAGQRAGCNEDQRSACLLVAPAIDPAGRIGRQPAHAGRFARGYVAAIAAQVAPEMGRDQTPAKRQMAQQAPDGGKEGIETPDGLAMAAVTGLAVERWSGLLALLDERPCEPAAVVEPACGAARWAVGECIGNFGRAARG
jgi:hypothetical protein